MTRFGCTCGENCPMHEMIGASDNDIDETGVDDGRRVGPFAARGT